MLPRSFVIKPEFNDLFGDKEKANEVCTIKQIKYRLYPTYQITVQDNRICGVSSSSWLANGSSLIRVSSYAHPSSLIDGSIQAHNDTILKQGSNLEPRTKSLFLHIRFPVIESIRTNEDTYATLICSPATNNHVKGDNSDRVSFEPQSPEGGKVIQAAAAKDEHELGLKLTTRLPILRGNAVRVDESSDEPVVEESQRRQLISTVQGVHLELKQKPATFQTINSSESSTAPLLTSSPLLKTIATTVVTEEQPQEAITSSSRLSRGNETTLMSIQQADKPIFRPGDRGETTNITKIKDANRLTSDNRSPLRPFETAYHYQQNQQQQPQQRQETHCSNNIANTNNNYSTVSSSLSAKTTTQKSHITIDSQFAISLMAGLSAFIMIMLILAILIDSL